MQVRLSPAFSSDLPRGVSTVVMADADVVGMFYSLQAPPEQRCADASAALTAALEHGAVGDGGRQDGNDRIDGSS
jgi:hypothetical protein